MMLTRSNSGLTAAFWGVVAGAGALMFFSEVPRVKKDIMQKLPGIGEMFHKEVPASDNVRILIFAGDAQAILIECSHSELYLRRAIPFVHSGIEIIKSSELVPIQSAPRFTKDHNLSVDESAVTSRVTSRIR